MYRLTKTKPVALLMACYVVLGMRTDRVYAAEEKGGLLKGLPVAVSVDSAIHSQYLWRGFTLDDDPVTQSGVYVNAYGFTASIWGSFDMCHDDSLNSDEVDYAIDYTYERGMVHVSVGHTYYDFPAIEAHSLEFYVGGGLDVFLSPTVTWYHDYGNEHSGGGDGDYLVLDVSQSLPVGTTPISLDFGGHVAYNHALFIEGDGGDAAVSAGLTIQLPGNCSVSPQFTYSIPFGDVHNARDGNQNDEFSAGVTVAIDF